MLVILSFAALLITITVADQQCNGPYEYLYEFTPVCQLNCTTLHMLRCTNVIEKPSCQCSNNTIRENGKCIPINDCPKYYEPLVCNGQNEHYALNVSACPRTCNNYLHGPVCHSVVPTPSCVCNDGYVLETVNMRCIAPQQCPVNGQTMQQSENLVETPPQASIQENEQNLCDGENEEYSLSRSVCPLTCQNLHSLRCLSIISEPSCICKTGTIRDQISGKCIEPNNCADV